MEQSATPIDPNDLLAFAWTAELGSFSRAAQRLGWPKSTVSRRIAQLENQLGERLLLRTTRRQTLTELGRETLEHARQVALELEAVTALREHRQALPRGRLRVSMPSDLANLLLTQALADFVQRHPDVALELDLSPRRVDLLGEGFDVAVRMGDLPDDTLLAARRLAVFSNSLYAAPAYLTRHGEPQNPQDLACHQAVRLLAGHGEPLAWTLHQGDAHWQGLPPGRVSANSPELLIRLAQAGAGIAGVPDVFALPQVRLGNLRRVLPQWRLPGANAWAVFPERRLMPTKTRAFVDLLQRTLAAMDGALNDAGAAAPPAETAVYKAT